MKKQVAHLPIIAQVNEGVILEIPDFLVRNNISLKNILIVSGASNSRQYAEQALTTMDARYYVAEHDYAELEKLQYYCLSANIKLIIAIGGGYVLDLVKRVSLLIDIENILVPSVISNDGLMSPIAVINDVNGKTHSLPGKMPMGIIVDIDIIQQAPLHFLQAAAGDILSNISATNDWVLANRYANELINDVAYMLSRSAAESLLHHESKNLRNRDFLKQIVYCQINSGLAMSLAGTSRPCSGSEHLISHAIDFKKLSQHTLHGYQVGSISIFCLYLQRKLNIKCLNYARELDIPLAFHRLNNNIHGKLAEIYETALTMRPGRVTVLDNIKEMKFEDMYDEFLIFLDRFKI